MRYPNYILDYYEQLKSGAVVAGNEIHKVYEIIIEDLQRGDYSYDAKKAYKAVTFIESRCRHSKGRKDLLKLETWQRALVAAMFGLVDKDGYRFYREIFIVVARKNGKSLLMGAIATYIAFLDGEHGGEIYFLATKLDQTDHVWSAVSQIIEKEPLLEKRVKRGRRDYYIKETNTLIKPLVFAPKTSDGFNVTLAVNDEVHAWAGNRGLMLYNTMRSGFGSRKQPLMVSISTAGHENEGIYDDLITRSTRFLNRDSRERRLLPFLYRMDDPEKWHDISEIKKANPNIGVSVPESFYDEEIAIAYDNLSKRREFLMKYCNVKQSATEAWIDNRLLEGAVKLFTLDDFRNTYAVGGVDLSQSVDLTAASVVIEREGILYAFCQFFMPAKRYEVAIEDDNTPYDIYLQQGVLTLSGENHVDYKDVYNWFVNVQTQYKIYLLKIGFDKHMARYLVDDLANFGFHMDDVFQGDNLAPIVRDLQGTIKDGGFIIANNHLLKAHFLNVALKHNNEKRTFRPVKTEQRKRIDGFVAVVDALTVRHKYLGEVGGMLANKGR